MNISTIKYFEKTKNNSFVNLYPMKWFNYDYDKF